jgi:hypothetical protein
MVLCVGNTDFLSSLSVITLKLGTEKKRKWKGEKRETLHFMGGGDGIERCLGFEGSQTVLASPSGKGRL